MFPFFTDKANIEMQIQFKVCPGMSWQNAYKIFQNAVKPKKFIADYLKF